MLAWKIDIVAGTSSASPVSAAQISLPPSTQSVREDEPMSHPGTAPQPAHATEKTEEKKGPTVQQSWEKLMAEVDKYDEGMVKNWKEDIDTLLVFAGLFSAVVTAFLIEAYQWLSEDPADTTVALLTHISIQLNAPQTMPLERSKFEPDASSIRINCWWFLSLVFSLTSALFGLLCKQWLREQQRDPPTATPAEALALRQMRRDSFEKWGVSPFLSVLPILLEVALLFFFVGILDLLWARHSIPFTFCLVSVALSAGLYFVTTFLPVLALFLRLRRSTVSDDLGFRKFTPSYHFICPYKSPQAWAVYQLLFKALHALNKIPSIESYIYRLPATLRTHIWDPASDWSSFDLRVIRRSSDQLSDSFIFNVHELRAFQWAFITFRDSPSMLPHIQNVLGTILPSVAMSAVLGDWELTMWGDIQKSAVERWFHDSWALRESLGWYIRNAPQPNLRDPTLLHSEGVRLLYFHQYWQELATRGYTRTLIRSIESHQAELQSLVNLRFVIPFTTLAKLWTYNYPWEEQNSQLLSFLEDAFSTHPGYDEQRHDLERLAFISALANHLNDTDFTSYVATSTRGQEFIRFVHDQILSQHLYEGYHWHESSISQSLSSKWTRVTQRIIEMGNLPPDYFVSIPEWPSAQFMDTGIFLQGIPNYPPRADDGQGVLGLAEQDEQGNTVAGDIGAEELADTPHTNIDPDHPRVHDRHSEYKTTGTGQEDVPGLVERGEQSNKVGGVGADERV
ncbi:hypothetical protein WG66_007298 [Moniliophthora roreri]|nr:hypothetical protein WG66_007298 [Moniliophthora roreri]